MQRTDSPLSTAEFFISIGEKEKARIVLDLMFPYCTTLDQLDVIGRLYADVLMFDKSLSIAKHIYSKVSTIEHRWNARGNIIRAYLSLNQPADALIYISVNESIDPTDHYNLMDKAMCLFLLNQKADAESILRKILTEPHLDDIDIKVNFNLGTYDLANGNFKSGIKHFLLDGRKLSTHQTCNLPADQFWEGGIQPGKTIIVYADAGIGDEIISVRFTKHLKDAGMNPIWFTSRRDIANIFERCGIPTTQTLDIVTSDCFWTYSMAVPAYLDLSEDQLWYGPYLSPNRLSESLPTSGKKKIGIKCTGNPAYDQDLHRSIPLGQLVDSIPEEYEIYSFHVDEDIIHPRVVQLKDKINSWDNTLNYIDQMDIIVSSCTSLAHASSAMGKKTYVIVPILNYYVWASPGNNSPWYSDSTTIFRQVDYNNWNEPLAKIKEILEDK